MNIRSVFKQDRDINKHNSKIKRIMKKTQIWLRIYLLFLIYLFTFSPAHSQSARSELLKEAIHAAEKKNYTKSFELLEKCLEISESGNDYHERFWTLTNMAINRAELLDYNEAVENLMNAYDIAINHLDATYEMSVLNNIAGIYMMDSKYDKANIYYKQVYNRIKDSKDSLFIGGNAMNIVMASSYLNQNDEAQKFLQIALNMLIGFPSEYLRAKVLYISELRIKKQLNEAHQLARELLKEANDLDDIEIRSQILVEQIKINLEKNNYASAMEYIRQSLDEPSNPIMKMNIYRLLENLLIQTQNYIDLVECRDSIILLDQAINDHKKQRQTELAQIKFELLRNKKDLTYSHSKLMNILIGSFIVILIISTLIILLIDRSKNQKRIQKIMQLELDQEMYDKQLLEDNLSKHKNQFIIDQERMKYEQDELIYELDLKNKELTAQAIYIAKRNELIEDLVVSLSQIQTTSHNEKLNSSIAQLKRYLRSNKEWDGFLTHFEQSNQKFITTLKERHPELSVNEIRFLSFVYLNLNNKEIGALMNIAPESCKKKKWLIAKKMSLSTTTILHDYLCSL